MLKPLRQVKLNEWMLIFISSAIALFWVFGQHVTFGMDSKTYFQYANWLVGNESISPHWYIRTPGLPLILVLTGVTKFKSFAGFMLFQAIISVAIVWLCYKIAQVFTPRNALTIAYLCIITCIPFMFSAAVMTEHLNVFGFCWLCCSLLYFHKQQSKRYVYMAVCATIFLFLMRPSNYYIFVLTLLFVAMFATQNRRGFVTRFVLAYALFMLCYASGFSLLKMAHPGYEGMSDVFQGIRAFAYHPYTEHGFKQENGAASVKVIESVRGYVDSLNSSEIAALGPNKLFAEYAEQKQQLVNEIFENPNGYYYNLITKALAAKYQRRPAEIILLEATAESYIARPILLISWIKMLFSTSANNYTGQMLFYQFMLKAGSVVENESQGFTTKVIASNGPATAELLQHVRSFIMHQNKWIYWEPKELFADFKDHPEELLNNIFKHPTHIYHWFIWQAVDREIDPINTSRLFLKAAIEGYTAHPATLLTFYDDFIAYFFGPDATYKTGARVVYWPNTGMGEQVVLPSMDSAMQKQILEDTNAGLWDIIYSCCSFLWLLSKPLIYMLCLYGAFLTWQTSLFGAYLLTWSLIIYNALIVTVFADPFFRYSSISMLLACFGASYALFHIIADLRKRRAIIPANTVLQHESA